MQNSQHTNSHKTSGRQLKTFYGSTHSLCFVCFIVRLRSQHVTVDQLLDF